LGCIKAYFGGTGSIVKQGDQSFQYVITSIKQITTAVLPHFDNYPLITQKRADYELFKQAIRLMAGYPSREKEHLTETGLAKIVALKASMNRGLSLELKATFPKIIPVPRPLVEDPEIKDPN
jgi:hypothetical protein